MTELSAKSFGGQVSALGDTKYKSDTYYKFDTKRINKGCYMISFSPPMNKLPAVIANQVIENDNNTLRNTSIVAVSTDCIEIETLDNKGSHEDCEFNFLVYCTDDEIVETSTSRSPIVGGNVTKYQSDYAKFVVSEDEAIFTISFDSAMSNFPVTLVNENTNWDESDNDTAVSHNADPVKSAEEKENYKIVKIKTGDADGHNSTNNFSFLSIAMH